MEIIKLILAQSMFLAAAGWLIKFIIEHQSKKDIIALGQAFEREKMMFQNRISADLEIMKSTINLENQKALEEFKSRISRKIEADKTRFNVIHSKIIPVIDELMVKFDEFSFEFRNLSVMLAGSPNNELALNRARNASEKYIEINSILYKNELYLGAEFTSKIRKILAPHRQHSFKNIVSCTTITNEMVYDLLELIESARNQTIQEFSQIIHPKNNEE